MARKPSHLGRTLRKSREAGKLSDSPIVGFESRDLNDEELAAIAKRKQEQADRLARIAARAQGKEV